jgi:tripeptide aminopeptidase
MPRPVSLRLAPLVLALASAAAGLAHAQTGSVAATPAQVRPKWTRPTRS